MLLAIYTNILHYNFILTIYENFKSVFLSYLEQTKIGKLACLFCLSFEALPLYKILIDGHCVKNAKYIW